VTYVLVETPSILLTTSRRPTKNMRTFCRDLSHTFPNIVRVNRGKLSLEGLAEKALKYNANKVIIVDRWKGGPGKIQFFYLDAKGLKATPPLVYLQGVKFRRDFRENMPRGRRIRNIAVKPSLNQDVERKKFEEMLANFFEIPFLSVDEAVNNGYDAIMQISQEALNRTKIAFMLLPEQVEIGPQIIVSHLIWELTK